MGSHMWHSKMHRNGPKSTKMVIIASQGKVLRIVLSDSYDPFVDQMVI